LVENDVLEVLARVEQGIAVGHANQPQVERIVKMPIDVRDRVWKWIQNPKVVTEKEWMELKEPITLVIFEIAKVIWQYGSPFAVRNLFKNAQGAITVALNLLMKMMI